MPFSHGDSPQVLLSTLAVPCLTQAADTGTQTPLPAPRRALSISQPSSPGDGRILHPLLRGCRSPGSDPGGAAGLGAAGRGRCWLCTWQPAADFVGAATGAGGAAVGSTRTHNLCFLPANALDCSWERCQGGSGRSLSELNVFFRADSNSGLIILNSSRLLPLLFFQALCFDQRGNAV